MASHGSNEMDISIEVNSELQADSSASSSKPILRQDEVTKDARNSLFYASLTLKPIKEMLLRLTDNAAVELQEKALSGAPLWVLDDLGEEHLNKEVYKIMFTPNNQRRIELAIKIFRGALNDPEGVSIPIVINALEQSLLLEASKATKTVRINPSELVNMFMDADRWLAAFPNVIARATILRKIVKDGNDDNSLIAMKAEFCLPTPHSIARECYFLRRSKKLNEHTWLIVDVSLEIPGSSYIRKPSGCLIEQADDGSKITFVEHNELANEGDLPMLFREQVSSGFAFRASRWTTMLRCQTEYYHLINQQVNGYSGGRSSLLRLARRMSKCFMRNVNSSTENSWKLMGGGSNASPVFMSSEYFKNYLGRPDGSVISVATSVRLPFTADKLYDSLKCAECHPKWDVAILGASANKELWVLIGNDPSNHVSVLNIKVKGVDTSKCVQACFTDSSSMYVVWTFIEPATMNAIMAGGDSDAVSILVSGAAVLPWDPIVETGGSILTVSFESLDKSEGPSNRKDALCSDITRTISLVNELCTTAYEDHGSDEDEVELLNAIMVHKSRAYQDGKVLITESFFIQLTNWTVHSICSNMATTALWEAGVL